MQMDKQTPTRAERFPTTFNFLIDVMIFRNVKCKSALPVRFEFASLTVVKATIFLHISSFLFNLALASLVFIFLVALQSKVRGVFLAAVLALQADPWRLVQGPGLLVQLLLYHLGLFVYLQ